MIRGLPLSLCASMIFCFGAFGRARAETRTYVIAIGNNSPPATADGGVDDELRALRYADDDAAAFFGFTRDLSRRSTLLTVLDGDSQRRFPDLVAASRAPTLVELRRVVAEYRQIFEEDRRAGHDPVLLFFYSGHGSRAAGRPPSLTLLDGPLTQEVLYDEVLAALPARYVHLLVDACHAEAVVRPRDLQAQPVDISSADAQSYAARSTLARFPHVGALIATASAAQAHEWDVYERGVFSHEVLSGLRGAADVNGDGRIEYSELYAFLAAANRGVADPRAHLAVVVHPPALNRRAPIVDLSAIRGGAQLAGQAAQLGWFHIEDEHGNRLADVRAELGFKITLAIPAGQRMFISNREGEAILQSPPGGRIELQGIRLHPAAIARRGAMDLAMQRGLFAAAFGPTYYRGFVDQNQELVPVPLSEERTNTDVITISAEPKPSRRPIWISLGVAAGLGAVAAVFSGLSYKAHQDWESTQLQRPATDARNQFYAFEGVTIGSAIAGAVAGAVGVGLFIHSRRSTRATPRIGIGARAASGELTLTF